MKFYMLLKLEKYRGVRMAPEIIKKFDLEAGYRKIYLEAGKVAPKAPRI